MYKSGVL